MSTRTIQIPDDLATRLENIAKSRGINVNKLITEIGAQALAEYDAEARFKEMAAKADIPAALAVLDRLDKEAP